MKKIILLLCIAVLLTSCSTKESNESKDSNPNVTTWDNVEVKSW